MAVGAITVFDSFKYEQMLGTTRVNFGTAVIKLMLLNDTLTPLAATHDFIDDLSANESTNTGSVYTGPRTVAVTVTSGATVRVKVAADETFLVDASGFANARWWVLYEDTAGAAATDPLICFGDFGSNRSNIDGALTIDFENTNGGTIFEY